MLKSNIKLRIFFAFMLVMLLTILYVIFLHYQTEVKGFEQQQQDLIDKQGRLVTHELAAEIASIRQQMLALSKNVNLLDSLNRFPNADDLPEKYFHDLKLFFPDVQDFFLVNRRGEQFGSPYKIELGEACVADINSTLATAESGKYVGNKPRLHPQFERVHFDMMFPTDIFGEDLLFFASFNAELLRKILVDHKLSPHTSYLIRQDSKYLIELYEDAVRATSNFNIGYFLNDEAIANIAYDEMVEGTGWRLVVVKDSQVFSEERQTLLQTSASQALVALLLWFMVVITIIRYVRIQQKLMGRLHEESLHDELTGLGNRRLLKIELPKSVQRFQRRGAFSAMLYMDLNNFKPVNDIYGHDVGDLVLKQFSNRLLELCRVEDILIRLGGDEFIVILNELGHDQITAVKALQSAMARYQDRLNQKYQINELELDVPPSIGSVLIDGSEFDADTLIKQADHIMYEIKQRGKSAKRRAD